MRVTSPNILGTDGNPITQRPPPRLIVSDGLPLDPDQAAGVGHAYKLFCDILRVSPAPYNVSNRTLPDGTRIRIEANGKDHTVYVTPARPNLSKPIKLGGYVMLPADKSHTSGWLAPSSVADSARAYLPATKDKAKLHVKLKAGAVDWRSADGKTILTWDHNGNNRYRTCLWQQALASSGSVTAASAGIYYKGTMIQTPAGVLAAAIFEGFLVFIADGSPTQLLYTPSPVGRIDESLAKGQFVKSIDPEWTVVTPTEPGGDWFVVSSYHFAPDGSVAGAAVVTGAYTSLDDLSTTWNLWQTRTTPLPQAKREMTLALSGGVPTASLADTTYTGEEFYVKLDGTALDTGTTIPIGETPTYPGDWTNFSGALTFGGKRLIGVDYASDGTELLLEVIRTGTGTLNTSASLGGDVDFRTAYTTKWGVYADGDALFEVNYNLPEFRYEHVAAGSTTTYSQSGGGTLLQEFAGVHELDARTLSAVIEKLTISMPGAMVDAVTPVHYTTTAATLAMAQETYINGELETSTAEAFRTAVLSGMTVRMMMDDADNVLELLRYGGPQTWTSVADSTGVRVVQFPTAGNFGGDSWYEYIFQRFDGDSRMTHNRFQSYPNQATDLLHSLVGGYGAVLGVYNFAWSPGLWAPASTPTGTFAAFIRDQTIDLGKTTERPMHGLAQRDEAPLEAVVQTRDWFLCQFERVVTGVIDRVTNNSFSLSGGYVEPLPVALTTHYLRDSPGSGWTQTDLSASIRAQVNAEIDPSTVDADSFHLDPVRPL